MKHARTGTLHIESKTAGRAQTPGEAEAKTQARSTATGRNRHSTRHAGAGAEQQTQGRRQAQKRAETSCCATQGLFRYIIYRRARKAGRCVPLDRCEHMGLAL